MQATDKHQINFDPKASLLSGSPHLFACAPPQNMVFFCVQASAEEVRLCSGSFTAIGANDKSVSCSPRCILFCGFAFHHLGTCSSRMASPSCDAVTLYDGPSNRRHCHGLLKLCRSLPTYTETAESISLESRVASPSLTHAMCFEASRCPYCGSTYDISWKGKLQQPQRS